MLEKLDQQSNNTKLLANNKVRCLQVVNLDACGRRENCDNFGVYHNASTH